MINLFSIFDSSTSLNYSINWLSSLLLLLFIPIIYWFIPSRFNYLLNYLLNKLINEFKVLLNFKLNNINIIIFLSLFYIIILNNFLGLFSYIFTSSSHIIFGICYSLIIWISIILFGWIKNINHIFTHLVPQGTPIILIFFIVIIETIRNIIRPGTLSVRLSANIIAGHLLITLISNNGSNLIFFILIIILLIQNLLIILELAVSIIQAYVFTVLSTLYRTEVL